MPTKTDDVIARAELLQQAIATLQLQMSANSIFRRSGAFMLLCPALPGTRTKGNLLVLEVARNYACFPYANSQ